MKIAIHAKCSRTKFYNENYRNIINPEHLCVCVYLVIKSSRDADSPRRRSLQPLLIILYIVYRWPQIQRFVVLEGSGLWRCNSSNLMHGELYSTIQGGALKSRPSFQIFIIHLHWSSISWQNKTQFQDYMYMEHVFSPKSIFFHKALNPWQQGNVFKRGYIKY